ncbi:hypothetical protein FJTKL_11872 [Diaporthe vaccinii]|uniref:Uncharacterized protein n=1 Tax=Diaporthe vaccinii TaxID=105482 RepID=A0ABR4FAC5_9PEZI
MFVVMLIRYACVTKDRADEADNDGQEGSAKAGSGLSSSGGDDGSLGSGGHEGSCALGNTRHTSRAAGGVDGSLPAGGSPGWGDSSGGLDGRGRVARDGHNTDQGGRGGSVGGQSNLGHVGARNNCGLVDNDSGSRCRGSGGGGQVSGHRSTSSDGRVVTSVGAADTLEVLDGLRNSLVRVTISVEALVDVLNKVGVRAVAGSIGVVNTADDEVPGADAGRDNGRARQSLSGSSRALLGGAGNGGQLRSRRLGSRPALGGVAGGEDGSLSGSHRADGRADSNNNGGSGSLALGDLSRAADNLGSAASDGLDGGAVDGRGGLEAGNGGACDLVGGRLGRGLNRCGLGRRGGGRSLGSNRGSLRAGRSRGANREGRLGAGLRSRRGLDTGGPSSSGLAGNGRHRRSLDLRGVGLGVLGGGAGGGRAVKGDGGDGDTAGRGSLGDLVAGLARRVDDSHVLGTTALRVLDVELEVGIKLGDDIDGADREGLDLGILAAAERGRALLLVTTASLEGLGSPWGETAAGLTLSVALLTFESTEAEASIG